MIDNQIPPDRFRSSTLCAVPLGRSIQHILAAALEAVAPDGAVHSFLQRDQEQLSLLSIDGSPYDLASYRRIFVVGAGKAGIPMAHATASILDRHLTEGVVVVKGDIPTQPVHHAISFFSASHPLPDQRGVDATHRIISLLEHATNDDLVIVLLSGGGSALLTAPVDGVSLDDLQATTSLLLGCGAPIQDINCLRKHLDRVKGGELARIAYPATVVTLILSDVVGNPLDVIASGPTVPDSTTFADAAALLERYCLTECVPSSVRAHIEAGVRGDYPDTPNANDPIFAHVQHVVIGSNQQAAEAAARAAHSQGITPLLLTTYAQGEAREVGKFLAGMARELARPGGMAMLPRPACIIVGGETTVTLRANEGYGGRNQEVALAAVKDMAGVEHVALITLATDGDDGPTDSAGAVVTGETWRRAREHGLDPDVALAHHTSYHFFNTLDDLLKPGPTHTNVNDLLLLFAW